MAVFSRCEPSRSTQGVRLLNLEGGDKVAAAVGHPGRGERERQRRAAAVARTAFYYFCGRAGWAAGFF